MSKFNRNDVVVRISYNKDVLFEIVRVIKLENNYLYILKGITERIEADSFEEDLEKVNKRMAKVKLNEFEEKITNRIKLCLKQSYDITLGNKNKKNKRGSSNFSFGTILHLDGDRRYSEKSYRYYKSLGLNAIVKNISENKQPIIIRDLLDKYYPDVLVITGHDGMIKKGTHYNDVYNYRNSRFFIKTVDEARKWSKNKKDISIFAGACQSFYEGIICAGANFASSPKRIMIDFLDPLIVAERIATTESTKFLTIDDIKEELRDGEDGIDGIGSVGRKKRIITTM